MIFFFPINSFEFHSYNLTQSASPAIYANEKGLPLSSLILRSYYNMIFFFPINSFEVHSYNLTQSASPAIYANEKGLPLSSS